MSVITGFNTYIPELLLGTKNDDLFVMGSGIEYAFGDSGSDTAQIPLTVSEAVQAYYFGYSTAAVTTSTNAYFFNGIRYLEFRDKTVDLSLIGSSFLPGVPASGAIKGLNTYLSETLSAPNAAISAFAPGEGDATVIGTANGVDILFLEVAKAYTKWSFNGSRATIAVTAGKYNSAYTITARDIDIIIMTDDALICNSNLQWLESTKGDLIDIKNFVLPLKTSFGATEVINGLPSSNLAIANQIIDLNSNNTMKLEASSWSDNVKINRYIKLADTGVFAEALMPDTSPGSDPRYGSAIKGGNGNDIIYGKAGWDILDGGAGNDLIHGGNGRDVITGGIGADELWGDFGWNTYRSEIDGSSDLIAVKSDQFLVNWLYGTSGNNPNGEKADVIEGLDAIDRIKIVGVATSDLTFAANTSIHGVSGIGIYAKGALEAIYTGGNLTLSQLQSMTSGDASAAAIGNTISAYGAW